MKHINPLLIGLLMTLLGIGNSWGAALDFPSADYHISGELHTLPGGQPKIYLSGSEKGASYVLYRDGQPISNQEGTGRSLLFLGDGTGTYTIAVETWKYPLFIKDSLKVTDFPGLEHIKSITRTKTEGPLKAEGGACWFDVILDSPVNKTVSQSLREISEICYQGRCSTWHPSYGKLITAYPAYPDKIRVVVMGKPNIGNEQYSFLQLGKTRLEVTQ